MERKGVSAGSFESLSEDGKVCLVEGLLPGLCQRVTW